MQLTFIGANQQPTCVNIPNFEFLPLFYKFPRELLEHGARYLIDMPRNPIRLLKDAKWRQVLVSDAFLSVLLDGSAFLVWPAFEVKAKLESFSGYDPLWKMARAIQWWEEALEIATNSTPRDFFRMQEDVDMPWISVEEATVLFPVLAYQAIERHELRPVIDAVKEMRCIEDYDARSSRAKIDFYRKWNHSQTKHPTVSWDAMLASRRYDVKADALDDLLHAEDASADFEETVCEQIDAKAFFDSLTEREQEILTLRNYGMTQKEIAEHLQYGTHSAVGKRMKTLVSQYEDFMDEHAGERIYKNE